MSVQTEIRQKVDQWIAALNAMFAGDPEPFNALYSHGDDATYMGGQSTYRIGWPAIKADWARQAEAARGGTATASDVHITAGLDMAVAQHFTSSKVTGPDGTKGEFEVRETSVFRKENGDWRMVCHHVDSVPAWDHFDE